MMENLESITETNSIIFKCRICFHKRDRMHSIFKRRNGASAFDKLVANTTLVIDRNDGGPTLICIQCLIDLENTVTFLKKCQMSNKILSSYNCEFVAKQEGPQQMEDGWYDNKHVSSEPTVVQTKELTVQEKKRRHSKGSLAQGVTKNFQCNKCSKLFARKENLQIHMRRHNKEYKYTCLKCGFKALTQSELHSHARTHMPCVKPHECNLCSKKFTTRTNLKIHMRKHTGERPVECGECQKTFISRSTLRVHMRVHTGEKPYMCSVCGGRFASNKLSRHMRSHITSHHSQLDKYPTITHKINTPTPTPTTDPPAMT